MSGAGRAADARLAGWLALADRGWRLFPVRPGSKVPAISQWSQRASSDPDRLTRYFREHPEHNAGIACGPSGLLVVDCDIAKDDQAPTRWRDGAAVFDDLAALHGGVPATWTVATPSGGRHLYYAAPADPVLGNTSRVLGPLLDTRGDGGQVLAPGSVLPAGGYELLDDTDPAPLPGWLTTQLTPPPATAAAAAAPALGADSGRALSARQAAYVASAVEAETERVRRAGRGGHNTAVFTAANALGQLVGAGALDRAEAEAAISAAAEHICTGPCDCTPREVAASIRSGLDRGTRKPRQLPADTGDTGSTAGPAASTPANARADAAGGDTVTTPHNDSPNEPTTDTPTTDTPATGNPTTPAAVPPLLPEQASAIVGASWAIAARDAAIEDGDATAAARLDGLAKTAILQAGGTGIDRHRLASELDYPGGAEAMVDPPELGDSDFRPRPDLAFDPTLGATTPGEAAQWLTARLGDRAAAERAVAELQAANRAYDPTSHGWSGSLTPHELEYLAQGGALPGQSFTEAMRRIEAIEPEDLIPTDLDSPIPFTPTSGPIPPARTDTAGPETGTVYTDADLAAIADAMARGDEQEADRLRAAPSGSPVSFTLRSVEDERDERDDPAVVATWAPVGPGEEVFTPRAAAARLTEHGLTDGEAAAAVAAYLDAAGRDTGTDMGQWGMDSHDIAAITRTANTADTAGAVVSPAVVPAPRLAPDADEDARRAQLARWHVDDHTAGSASTQAAEEGMQR